jgi:hypothetical protein
MKAVMVVCRTAMESRGDRTKKMLTFTTEWKPP